MLFRYLLLLISFPVSATVFQIQPIEKQIQEADGVIIGHYLRKKSVQLEDGTVATQMIFKMNKEIGLQSDFLGTNEVIIHYPGGKIGENTVKVGGVPEFIPGESVSLFVKNYQDRYWGLNLGMGSFKVVKYGQDQMIINTVFPDDQRLSQMKIEEFERRIKLIKGQSLKIVQAPHYPTESGENHFNRAPASVDEGKNRSIASKSNQRENEDKSGEMNPYWLVLFLAVLGGMFRLFQSKKVK